MTFTNLIYYPLSGWVTDAPVTTARDTETDLDTVCAA